jgi:hypothetical protein
MKRCLIRTANKHHVFPSRITTGLFHNSGGSFLVIDLPYTAEELCREKILRRAARRINRIISSDKAYVYVPSCPVLENALNYRIPDGANVTAQLADRLLQKIIKNHGIKDAVIGVYDNQLTCLAIQLIERAAEVSHAVLVFTERKETAEIYADRIFNRTGTPVCICSSISEANLILAVDECPHTSAYGVDICEKNPDKPWVRRLLFRFTGEAEEMNELFNSCVDQKTIDFLLVCGVNITIGENTSFIGYS